MIPDFLERHLFRKRGFRTQRIPRLHPALRKKMNNHQSSFSIVTPSFNQLDWLRLCVASVRDQVAEEIVNSSLLNAPNQQSAINNSPSAISTLRVEHIIQDAGTPGIEEFAKETGADFYRDGVRIADYSLPIAHSENQQSAINNMQSRYRLVI